MPPDYNAPIPPQPQQRPLATIELTFADPALVETRVALLSEFAATLGFQVESTVVDDGRP